MKSESRKKGDKLNKQLHGDIENKETEKEKEDGHRDRELEERPVGSWVENKERRIGTKKRKKESECVVLYMYRRICFKHPPP